MNKMNQTEVFGCNILKALGWEVIKPSWPDFLIFKPLSNEFKFIEIKGIGDRISKKQKKSFELLKGFGISVEILVVNRRTEQGQLYNRIDQKLLQTGKLKEGKKRQRKSLFDTPI